MTPFDSREQSQLDNIEDQTRGVPWPAFGAFVLIIVTIIGWMMTQMSDQEKQIQAIQPQFSQIETQLAQVQTDVSWVKTELQNH